MVKGQLLSGHLKLREECVSQSRSEQWYQALPFRKRKPEYWYCPLDGPISDGIEDLKEHFQEAGITEARARAEKTDGDL